MSVAVIRLLSVYADGVPREGAVSFLYDLLAARPSGANISHDAMPSLVEHERFVRSHPYREWLLILQGEQWVGAGYLTHRNEVGIAIAPAHQRQGYARQALEMLTTLDPLPGLPGHRNSHYVAHVAVANRASRRLFAGWHPLSITVRQP